MPETINYAAMDNVVVLVGDRSANGAVHTSVGRSPTTRAIWTSFSTIQGLKARTIPAPFSCVSCVSWLEITSLRQGSTIGLSQQRFRGLSKGGVWGQARCLAIKTKRQQAAALETLRAYQRPMHPRQRVTNHRDGRPDPMGPYGDRHVVGSERCRLSLGAGLKGWHHGIRTRTISSFRVNAELSRRSVVPRIRRCCAHGCHSPAFRRNSFMKLTSSTVR